MKLNTTTLNLNHFGIDMSDDNEQKTQSTQNPSDKEQLHLRLEEQLLRTVKYTGETNKSLMQLAQTQQEHAARSQTLQEEFYQTQQENIKKENKYRRFKVFALASPLVLGILMLIFSTYQEYAEYDSDEGYVAQVTITGTIQQGSSTAGAESVIAALRKAFADEKAKGVLIRISSPGGSPTQSHMIHDEIVRLRELHPDKKVSLIGEEMVTSGALWIASAVPDIAVMETTYVGSVGVITTMFNFSSLIEKVGIDRLVITSGESKSILDQFQPPKEKDIAKMRSISTSIHETFIATMLKSRGDRLKAAPSELFTGDFWMGSQAVELGLVDEVITPTRLMLRDFGTVKYRDYSKRPSFMESMGIAQFAELATRLNNLLASTETQMAIEAK